MLYVGQKVVCVDDTVRYPDDIVLAAEVIKRWPNLPKKNEIYIVRYVRSDGSVLLNEIVNPLFHWNDVPGLREGAFGSWRFRPVVERKTDISVFERLLRVEQRCD